MFGNEDFEEFKRKFSASGRKEEGMSIAFGIPHEFKDFLEQNPELAKEVGKLICFTAHFNMLIKELEGANKEVKEILVQPELFEKFLVDPTNKNKEELISFLMAIQEARDPVVLRGMTTEDRDKIKEQFGDRVNIQDIVLGRPPVDGGDDMKTIWKKKEDDKDKKQPDLGLN